MQSKPALCLSEASVSSNYQCAVNLIVQLSRVGDDDMSPGSRFAESKVGRIGKPSHQMTYYVIAKLHESGIQLQTKAVSVFTVNPAAFLELYLYYC